MVDAAALAADLLEGVILGCVFAVVAHGLNIIWGVAKVVNIAHGEFIMFGAYGAYFLNLFWRLDPLLSAVIDAIAGLGVGVLFYVLFLFRELKGKESVTLQSEMVTLVSTFGLSLALQNIAVFLYTGTPVGIPQSAISLGFGGIAIPVAAIEVAIASVAIISLTDLFMTRTFVGNAVRAYSQDIPAASLMGINAVKIGALATAIGFSTTMAGGALLTVLFPTGIYPQMGAVYAPISFVIVVLGGPGKMWGSLVGGVILGVLIDALPAFLPTDIGYEIATAAAFLVLIPVLVFRPEGILR